MSKLSEFKDLVNDIHDEELLAAAEGLLLDMVDIENMKEKIETLEEGLHKGKRAAFWFFTVGLSKDDVDLATNTVIGRKRFLKEKIDRVQMSKDVAEGKYDVLPETKSEQVSVDQALDAVLPDDPNSEDGDIGGQDCVPEATVDLTV